MNNELRSLQEQLCTDTKNFCRECFVGSAFASVQNPPNVFRAGRNAHAKIFFIFDKPNNNDDFRRSHLVPITIGDPRQEFGAQPTYDNLRAILDGCGIGSARNEADPVDSELVHITNAVKCDKCATSGQTGGITIGKNQARNCVSRFLLRELAIIKPVAVVFFSVNAQRSVLNRVTKPGEMHFVPIDGVTYRVMRVPHTAQQSFNTHGDKGEFYREPFRNLLVSAGIVGHLSKESGCPGADPEGSALAMQHSSFVQPLSGDGRAFPAVDRKSTRLNSSH